MSDQLVTQIFVGGQVLPTWSPFEMVIAEMQPGMGASESGDGAELRTALVRITTIFGQRHAVNPNAVTVISEAIYDDRQLSQEARDSVVQPGRGA